MKKLLIVAFAGLMVVGFMGCNSSNQKEVKTLQDSITVLNTKIENMSKVIDSLTVKNDTTNTQKKQSTKPKTQKKVVKKHKI